MQKVSLFAPHIFYLVAINIDISITYNGLAWQIFLSVGSIIRSLSIAVSGEYKSRVQNIRYWVFV